MRRRLERLRSPWALALAAVLALALGLRLWGIQHGLPFVYNLDEGTNFVPKAIRFFSGTLDPGYFENPPLFSYVLHAVFAFYYGGGWPFGARAAASEAYATDATEVFTLARLTAALLGTAAVGLVYAFAARLYDRRVGLVAALLMAVAFLPVFYSHLALNDVPASVPLLVSLYGSAGILVRERRRDWVLAGLGLGLAVATKYTTAIAVVPLVAAAGLRALDRPGQWLRQALSLVATGAGALAVFFLANPHALLSSHEFLVDVYLQRNKARDYGKFGQTISNGVVYYLWTLTWGLGIAPAAAALGGAVVALRDDWRKALLVVPAPVIFIVAMGLQSRYFGRWLMPALPFVIVLAAYTAVRLADLVRGSPRLREGVLAGLAAALCAQALWHVVHVDRVLTREDTRAEARRSLVRNVPAGNKIVIEPIVPGAWIADPGRLSPATDVGNRWIKYPVGKSTVDNKGRPRPESKLRKVLPEEYELILRPALFPDYEGKSYCWVVTGSTQRGRAQAQPGRGANALAYYRELERRGRKVFSVSPYKPGQGPVKFNFDWSFDYYPLAYQRPGPAIDIYRLDRGNCARR